MNVFFNSCSFKVDLSNLDITKQGLFGSSARNICFIRKCPEEGSVTLDSHDPCLKAHALVGSLAHTVASLTNHYETSFSTIYKQLVPFNLSALS